MRQKAVLLALCVGHSGAWLGVWGCSASNKPAVVTDEAVNTDIWFPDLASTAELAPRPQTSGVTGPGMDGGTSGGADQGAGQTGAGGGASQGTGQASSGPEETATSAPPDPVPEKGFSLKELFPDPSSLPEPHPAAGVMPSLGKNPKIFDPRDKSALDHPSYQPPGENPSRMVAIDWGYFSMTLRRSGALFASAKYENPRGAHQRLLVGVGRFSPHYGAGEGVKIYNGYTVFDASKVSGAKAAYFEFFIRHQTAKMNHNFFMRSEDPAERMGIFPVEQMDPQTIIDAPPQMQQDNSIDPWICKDLGDGVPYGVVDLSKSLVSPAFKVHPSPFAVKPRFRDCSTPEGSCGRWVSVPLSEKAVADINAGKGLLAMGLSLISSDYARPTWEEIEMKRPDFTGRDMLTEWCLITANGDDWTWETGYPGFVMPAPRVRLTYEER